MIQTMLQLDALCAVKVARPSCSPALFSCTQQRSLSSVCSSLMLAVVVPHEINSIHIQCMCAGKLELSLGAVLLCTVVDDGSFVSDLLPHPAPFQVVGRVVERD